MDHSYPENADGELESIPLTPDLIWYNLCVACSQLKDQRSGVAHAWVWARWYARCLCINWYHAYQSCEMCNWKSRRSHIGPEFKHAERTYNMTVKHCCCILSTTKISPGLWNDKTLVLFDTFICGMIEGGNIHNDYTCEVSWSLLIASDSSLTVVFLVARETWWISCCCQISRYLTYCR